MQILRTFSHPHKRKKPPADGCFRLWFVLFPEGRQLVFPRVGRIYHPQMLPVGRLRRPGVRGQESVVNEQYHAPVLRRADDPPAACKTLFMPG